MKQESEDWPFDADRDDPLVLLRIPVTCAYPTWVYLAAFDRDSEARPTDAEALALASWIDFQRDYFNETWRAKLHARPLDVEGGHVTTIFHKWGCDDWGYRLATWVDGYVWWPRRPHQGPKASAPMTLVALMDRNRSFGDDRPGPRWLAWKTSHPEAFPTAQTDHGDWENHARPIHRFVATPSLGARHE